VEEFVVKILNVAMVTHNVKQIRVEKPTGYSFTPGQATDVSVNTPELKSEKRPFTFTCLNSDPYLEFTIKIYPERKGVTNAISGLHPGSELILRDVWGDIAYRGKGVFIAGGAGITPFVSIFRDLGTRNDIPGNMLIFANKKKNDIIYERELSSLLGSSFINILSDEQYDGYNYGFITEEFLKASIPSPYKNYYICGPPPMIDKLLVQLSHLGVGEESIVMESM